MWFERISIMFILAGTILLAFCLKIEAHPGSNPPRIYSLEHPFWRPTQAMFVPWMFRGGLGLIGLGALLQFIATF